MNEQVLTTMTSASSARRVSSAPARASRPIMTSLSTRFLGQPRLTKPTFCGRSGRGCSACGFSTEFSFLRTDLRSGLRSGEPLTVRYFTGMQSFYFSISRHGVRGRQPTGRASLDGRPGGGCPHLILATSARGYPTPLLQEWVRKVSAPEKIVGLIQNRQG